MSARCRANFRTPRGNSLRIKYSEFDSYDAEAFELWNALEKLQCEPIVEVEGTLAIDIDAAIRSSENVVRFAPKKK
jgi:hypothetical protein